MSVKSHVEKCGDLMGYLKTLSKGVIDDLFSFPPSCLTIFRELPALSQQYVMRLLYVDQQLPQAVISSWIDKSFEKDHTTAAEWLTGLRILSETSMSGGLPGNILNDRFRHNLKIALLGGGKCWTNTDNMEGDSKPRSTADLDSYALTRWESILLYLTEKQQGEDTVSRDTIVTLTHAKLMESDSKHHKPTITKEGFQFLLLDMSSQVWYFIAKYLEQVENRGMILADCLNFLFMLSFTTLGREYSSEGYSDHMLLFIQHLREFGLIYQRTRKNKRFYPTRLAINLVSSKHSRIALDTEKRKTGFLVVETNYRVYCYSDSDLQLALVAMFTQFLYRFPNLVVSVITRDSIRQALRTGISAEQIISFLKMHVHSEMVKGREQDNNLPPTVVDQIKLWEMERNRFSFTSSVLYNQFLSQKDYETVRDHSQDIGALIYSNDAKRTVVVKKSGHDEMRKFWKRHSKGT